MMRIVEVATGKTLPIEIVPVEKEDYQFIGKSSYYFDWDTEQKEEVYNPMMLTTNPVIVTTPKF